MVMLVTFCSFSFGYPSMAILVSKLATEILLVTVAPPLETLLTQFRKLQPSPLEVGDHFILNSTITIITI